MNVKLHYQIMCLLISLYSASIHVNYPLFRSFCLQQILFTQSLLRCHNRLVSQTNELESHLIIPSDLLEYKLN